MKISHSLDFLLYLHTIDWFSQCGAKKINRATILKEITKTKWENLVLHHREESSVILAIKHPAADREWNNLTVHFKQQVLPKLEVLWQDALKPYDLADRAILGDISFNVLNYALLKTYEPYVEIPAFYKELFAIYEQGKLPYGWKGTREMGEFLVY